MLPLTVRTGTLVFPASRLRLGLELTPQALLLLRSSDLEWNYTIGSPFPACWLQTVVFLNLYNRMSQFLIIDEYTHISFWFCFSGEPWLIHWWYNCQSLWLWTFFSWRSLSIYLFGAFCSFFWEFVRIPEFETFINSGKCLGITSLNITFHLFAIISLRIPIRHMR